MAPILVLGIGNILLRDEGVGVRVIEAMREIQLPSGVELMDGGTSGVDLVDEIADRSKLIVVDAARSDEPPGTIFRMGMEDLLPGEGQSMSLHEFGLLDTLVTARTLGCLPRQIVIFGVQPRDVTSGLELSETIQALIPGLIKAILAECEVE